jgi:phenylacetate-coenzyme A ligase PaaK-like adenylate-forming protein
MSSPDLAPLRSFLETPLALLLAPERLSAAQERVLTLFRSAAEEVPAYRAFLEAQRIAPAAVKSFEGFQRLPLVTKDNYMRAYPLPQRCRNGRLCDTHMVAVSSGSTGRPMFWPRTLAHELEVAVRFEQVFRDAFRADERSTLAVVCFAMGTWVGGMYTAQCCRYLAQKGYALTLVTPGNDKREIFRVVSELGPAFDHVVLLGYPPFLKDVIDSGSAEGMDWRRLSVKLVFAGEVFSEEWRAMVCDRIGTGEPCCDTASLYGTADAGVLGNETPLSIAVRRMLARHPDTARELFGESRLPTLVQYDPHSRFFEVVDETLVVSADGGVPLVRYHIADRGGVIPYDSLLDLLRAGVGDPLAELPAAHRGVRELPFVYVFGRADFTVSYFGANIYPENVTVGLEQAEVRAWVTGKFVLEVEHTPDGGEFLAVAVELLPNVSGTDAMRERVAESILRELLRLNSEFAHYVPPEYQRPVVRLLPCGDPRYFPAGIKHRYTRKPTGLTG